MSDKKNRSVVSGDKIAYYGEEDVKQSIKELKAFFNKPEDLHLIYEVFGEGLI